MLAPRASLRDHPSVEIILALAAELFGVLYVLSIVVLVGTTAFHFLVWRRTALPLGPVRAATDEQMYALVSQWGTWSSLALLILTVPRTLGVASLLDDRVGLLTRASTLVLRTEWGVGFAANVLAAVLSLGGYVLVSRRRSIGWPLVLAGVPLLAVGAGLQGHPFDAFATLTAAPLFDGLHTIGVGAWLGSFFVLVLAERRVAAHTSSPWTDPLGAMLERYYRISGALITLVLLTGLFSSSTHLTGFDDIEGTHYGHVLAGKVGIVLIVLAFAEYHRRHAERQARTIERPQLVHTMRFQVGLVALVIALTALLVDTAPPGVNEVQREVFHRGSNGAADAGARDVAP